MIRKMLLGLGMTLALTGAATAGDYCPPKYKYVTCYETVTCWEVRKEAYTKCVTKYDHCGKPYQATVTCYRDVKVPVIRATGSSSAPPIIFTRAKPSLISSQRFRCASDMRLRSSASLSRFCSAPVVSVCDSPA